MGSDESERVVRDSNGNGHLGVSEPLPEDVDVEVIS